MEPAAPVTMTTRFLKELGLARGVVGMVVGELGCYQTAFSVLAARTRCDLY